MLLLYLTAVLSVSFSAPCRISLRGIWFALNSATYKIGFPGWPEPILDSVTGFGVSITKRGLAPAPFFISVGRLAAAQETTVSRSPMKQPTAAPDEAAPRQYPPNRWSARGSRESLWSVQSGPCPNVANSGRQCERWHPGGRRFSLQWMPKKMSGRWGERPLGRGGWRVQ
jgi:hypothetical protein